MTKHVDLFLETTGNIEVKVRRELMQGGYSTDLDTINMFVKSSKFLIKLQRINLLASLKHKKQLRVPVKNMEYDKETFHQVVRSEPSRTNEKHEIWRVARCFKGLLKSDKIDKNCLHDFILKRIKGNENNPVFTDQFFCTIQESKVKNSA